MPIQIVQTKAPVLVEHVAFSNVATGGALVNPDSSTTGLFNCVFKAAGGSCYIAFGSTSAVTAANTDWPLNDGEMVEFKISKDSRYFSVLQNSGPGVLHWYVPGQSA